MSPTAWFRNAFNLSGSIARVIGAVVVAIAVLLGRNQETRAYAMKVGNWESGMNGRYNSAASIL
jgi:hypothetical protein